MFLCGSRPTVAGAGRHDLAKYVFGQRELVKVPGFANEREQAAFRHRLAVDKDAIDWLTAHGSLYLRRVWASDGVAELAMLKKLRERSNSWMLEPTDRGLTWLKEVQDLVSYNTRCVGDPPRAVRGV